MFSALGGVVAQYNEAKARKAQALAMLVAKRKAALRQHQERLPPYREASMKAQEAYRGEDQTP